MHLTALDWWIVVISLGITFIPAIVLARRAGKNTAEFFAAGRKAPWWLIGISLVATTFSTDTPNLVTNFVRDGGVAENWAWWSFLLTGMATVFFYARLWRRSGVLTDLEFYELRYSGKAATFVRAVRAIYLGLFFNCFIIASVNLAAVKIASVLFGWPRTETLLLCAIVPIIFAATAGLWGVMVTDTIQFGITITASFAAAYYAIHAPGVGGLHGMIAHVASGTSKLALDSSELWRLAHRARDLRYSAHRAVVVGLVSGLGTRRRKLCRTTHACGAQRKRRALWYVCVSSDALRAASVAVDRCRARVNAGLSVTRRYPRAFSECRANLLGNDIAYPAMLVFLPAGFAGLMVAGLFAAYRSTIETHLNWGTSYLVHDFYRRLFRPDASEHHYVFVGRIVTVLLMVAGHRRHLPARYGERCIQSTDFDWCGYGLDLFVAVVLVAHQCVERDQRDVRVVRRRARFFTAGQTRPRCKQHDDLLVTVRSRPSVWLVVTFLTPADDQATLARFYDKVRPMGPGWRRVRRSRRPASVT